MVLHARFCHVIVITCASKYIAWEKSVFYTKIGEEERKRSKRAGVTVSVTGTNARNNSGSWHCRSHVTLTLTLIPFLVVSLLIGLPVPAHFCLQTTVGTEFDDVKLPSFHSTEFAKVEWKLGSLTR